MDWVIAAVLFVLILVVLFKVRQVDRRRHNTPPKA
jgi:hypothetical protein